MVSGYEDIDNLNKQTSQLYDEQMKQQQNIINTSTQQAINEIERNKQKAQEEADKTNKALYVDYQKQINPYGVNAENLYEQGLANSGLAETTKAHYYNTYQSARTEAQNNANQIKADFDNEITRARQNGDLQLAQSALQMYQQKINDLYNTYNLKYQRDRDTVSDTQWQKEYEQALQNQQWQQAFNEKQFEYQKERDAIADDQWRQQFEASRRSYSGGSSGGNGGSGIDPTDSTPSQYDKYANMAGTLANDLKTIYAKNTDTFKQNVLATVQNRLKQAINNNELTEAEAREIFNSKFSS